MKKLMILDPCAVYADSLRSILGNYCEILVCDRYASAADAIAEIHPDYMIMDFTASEFEGFTVLRSAIALGANPAVIGIVHASYFFDMMCNKEKNICSTVYRPVDGVVLASRLTCMMELPTEQLVPLPTRRQFVEYMLSSLGIPIAWAGGKNLISIIPVAADNPEMKVTKHLYPVAFRDSYDSVENVEKNIRKAIEHGFENGNPNAWARYFSEDGKGSVPRPSNAKFIGLLAEILNQHKGQYWEDE